MSKQPTATRFTQREESWARFILGKTQQKIEEREAELTELGIPTDRWSDDVILMDLYDDELFYIRYDDKMAEQRNYIREKYLGE